MLDGHLERVLTVLASALLLFHIVAQMRLQFVEHFGSFEAGGKHLSAPIGNRLFEVKHVVPSRGPPTPSGPSSIAREVWRAPFGRPPSANNICACVHSRPPPSAI